MPPQKESDFAEVPVDRLLLESFANEQSAYRTDSESQKSSSLESFKQKLRWHIDHSLSPRQKQVIRLYLMGWKERQIALDLGVKQQVVHIYKHRAINKLGKLLKS